MSKSSLIIATRESPLALWQANWVKQQLQKHHPSLKITLLGLTTTADKLLETPLYQVGGKGLFVKELEEALLDGRADIAVHSMKDVPMELPPGLCLPVMCEREDPHDAFVSNQFETLQSLPSGAILGTSSLRRQSQLVHLRPDVHIESLRGNVNTRLKRLDSGDYTALILAAAGLKRLGFEKRIRSTLSIEQCLPAAGQGVLGIECRENDAATKALILPLNHTESYQCVLAERALCSKLGGGCQLPVAAYAEIRDEKLFLRGLVASSDGAKIIRAECTDLSQNAEKLGSQVADDLLQQGANEILHSIRK